MVGVLNQMVGFCGGDLRVREIFSITTQTLLQNQQGQVPLNDKLIKCSWFWSCFVIIVIVIFSCFEIAVLLWRGGWILK